MSTKLNKINLISGILVILAIAGIGLVLIFRSGAEGPYVESEAESGVLNGPTIKYDTNTSNNNYVQFGSGINLPSSYKGIFQFTGTPQYTNPDIKGGVLIIPWATVEPEQNVFDWSTVNSQIAPWVAAGKKVAIRIQANELDDSDTPSWVFSGGVPQINPYSTVEAPIFWNSTYLSDLQNLAKNFGAEYDGDNDVAWVQATIGVYSETKVDTDNSSAAQSVWDANGYTDPLWFSTVKTMAGYYQQYFTKTPLVVSIDKSFIDGNAGLDANSMVDWLTSVGIWPQDDGLRQTTTYTDTNWFNHPHISEQYLATDQTGDSLLGDFQAGMAANPTYMLIYGSDINTANQAVLSEYSQ